MKKMTLEDFIVKPHDEPKWDLDSLKKLMDRNFVLQMMDVWGEADKVIQAYKNNKKENILKQLSNFHDVCNIIYLNENIDEKIKWELKVAEWELYDFCLWENLFQNDATSVMKWF